MNTQDNQPAAPRREGSSSLLSRLSQLLAKVFGSFRFPPHRGNFLLRTSGPKSTDVHRDSIIRKIRRSPPRALVKELKEVIAAYLQSCNDLDWECSDPDSEFLRREEEDATRASIFDEGESLVHEWFQEGIPEEEYDLYNDDDLDHETTLWALELIERLIEDVEQEAGRS